MDIQVTVNGVSMFKRFLPFGGRKDVPSDYSILVVSDDDVTSTLVSQTLSENGYEIFAAANMVNALETLKTIKTPHLIIGDFVTPQVDGVEFLTRASIHIGKSTLPPVLFLVDAKEDEMAARTVGAQELMSKPVDAAALLTLVEKMLIKTKVVTAK
jgi:DNA-binding response OmpR family regulator